MNLIHILPAQQFGFRREHNTCQPLVKIRNVVKNNFRHSVSTGMVLLDIKAAFRVSLINNSNGKKFLI